MTARLILARHGRTASNVTHTMDSRPPGGPLDELGLVQAAELGLRLADEPVTAVYASRATRAQQTAAPVAAAPELDVMVLDGVQEVFVGDLEGRADADARDRFDAVYEAWAAGDLEASLPGGESAHAVIARFRPVVERITAGAPGTVVLVSHGAAIRVVAGALLGDRALTSYVGNAGVVVLVAAGGGWGLEHWDEVEPIPGDVTAGGSVE